MSFRTAFRDVSIWALPPSDFVLGLSDEGVRSGQDVLRALALAARACLLGRAYIFGLGAAGEAGVRKAIDIIRSEFDISMALTGINPIREIASWSNNLPL